MGRFRLNPERQDRRGLSVSFRAQRYRSATSNRVLKFCTSFLSKVLSMNVVILAAGLGKRMQSALPKVLHPLAGKSLLAHVINTARSLSPTKLCVIYGHGGDAVLNRFTDSDLIFAKQEPQLGTGHAVMQALPQLDDSVPTLVLYGDVPLTSSASLQRLVNAAGNDKLA